MNLETSRSGPARPVEFPAYGLALEAEGVGFEPTGKRSLPTVFKTVPINHSGTPPDGK